MSIKAHILSLSLCLHNSFLKKLIPEYFSAVTHAVPPKEIGRKSFATMLSRSI